MSSLTFDNLSGVAAIEPRSIVRAGNSAANGTPAAHAATLPTTQISGPYNLRLLAVSAAGFCVFLSVYATQSLLPLLARTFHASVLHASLTVTATTLAVALAAPVVGLIAERVGRKAVIVSAIFALAFPTFMASTAGGLNALIGWRFAQGLVMPGIIAVTMAYIAEEWDAEQVSTAMSAYVTGNVLAGVVGRFMTGWIAAHYGWSCGFVALAILDVIGGLIVWKGLPASRHLIARRPPMSQTLRDMARHFGNAKLVAAFTVGFCILMVLVATFTYITYPLAARPFNLGPAGLGSLFLVYLLGVLVTPVSGRYSDRFGQRNALRFSLAASVLGLALTLIPSLPTMVIGLAVCSSGVFVCQSITASYMGLAAGNARASAAGLYASFYYLGGAAGAFVPGLFWRFGGWPATVALLAAVLVLTGITATVFWRDRA